MLLRLSFLFIMSIQTLHGQDLELEWSVFHPVKKEWIELGSKGSVQELLISTGEMPDPFYGTNEDKFGWIENHQWAYKSMFFIDSAQLSKNYVELDLPSLDTYAEVRINDSLLTKTKNAFLPYRFDVKGLVKEGMNEIDIIFTPPVVHHKERWENEKYHLPAPNDAHDIAIAPYTRKPQYQFGWDWSLRMNTIGLNKSASLKCTDHGTLVNKTVRVLDLDIPEKKATIQVEFQITNKELKSIVMESEIFGRKSITGGDGVFYFETTIEDPKLWWPRGFGEQFIYEDVVKLFTEIIEGKVSENQFIKEFNLNFGIKKSELIQEADEWGTSYYFKINGKRIFCKGANYIPQDIFPAQVTDDEIRSMVENMVDANFNMVRVWGGGYYPDDVFYEECDRAGIMVWQDLMFACAMYPGWTDFIDNVAYELEYHVPRISAHPSVMLFNGNNEVEVAWGNWGFQIKYGLYGEEAREIEKAYDDIFKVTAKNIVGESMTPYIHTSPLSNWGKSDFYNHGSQHYWGVWHGKDPMEDFGKKIGRFNAEYGFQSFPEYSTLLSFSTKDDWDIDSDVMKHHQKSYVGNNMIMKHAKRLYGNPDSFEEFVYYSQLTQSMAVSMAIAGHRLDAPRCGGTLVWQLNDCWPVSSWSSVDYFGNWKALHYRMRDDYKDVTVLAKYNDLNDVDYYLVSDLPGKHQVRYSVTTYDLKGKELTKFENEIVIDGAMNQQISLDLNENKCKKQNDRHVVFEWTIDGGSMQSRSFDHLVSGKSNEDKDGVAFHLSELDLVNKTAFIIVENDKFIRDFWISSDKFGVKFSSNFQSFLPGRHEISISFEEIPKLEDFRTFWN